MRSRAEIVADRATPKAGFGLTAGAWFAVLFLNLPILFIVLYGFTTDDQSYSFPPPGLTTKWFAVTFARADFWHALWLSVSIAFIAMFFTNASPPWRRKTSICALSTCPRSSTIEPGLTCRKRWMIARYSTFCAALLSSTAEFGSKKKRMSFDSSGPLSSAPAAAVRIGAMAIF